MPLLAVRPFSVDEIYDMRVLNTDYWLQTYFWKI